MSLVRRWFSDPFGTCIFIAIVALGCVAAVKINESTEESEVLAVKCDKGRCVGIVAVGHSDGIIVPHYTFTADGSFEIGYYNDEGALITRTFVKTSDGQGISNLDEIDIVQNGIPSPTFRIYVGEEMKQDKHLTKGGSRTRDPRRFTFIGLSR